MTGPDRSGPNPRLRLRQVLFLFLVSGLLAPCAWAQGGGRVMVVWAAGIATPPADELLRELGEANGVELRWVRDLAEGLSLLAWRSALEEARIVAVLQQDPRVEAVQADARRRLRFVPTDTHYGDQWYLFEAAGIEAPAAWDLQRGSSSVVVAVLDTGILPHEDIDPARVLRGYDFYSDEERDNDGQPGWDADPSDPGDAVEAGECGVGTPAENSSWHGLAVTGVLMATADNGRGIAGVDHRARLLPIRVFGKCGAWASDLFDAMRWAVGLPVTGVSFTNTHPAGVINLSLSYDAPCGLAEQRVIDEVIGRGAVVVAAAGNGGDVALVSPASCRGVITVAATNRAGERTYYTSVGAAVDIAAPGGDVLGNILTTHNTGLTAPAQDGYAYFRGTSFSAPQVAGVLALMRAERPAATVDQLRQALLAGAKPFPDSSCTTSLCGAGLLDAEGAILALRALPEAVASSGGGGGCVQLRGDAARPEALWWLLLSWVLYRRLRRNHRASRRV